jgi:hypothetical protein
VIVEAAVLVSGAVAARFGVLLEQLVRAEARRTGELVPDDLSRCCSSWSTSADGGAPPIGVRRGDSCQP